MHFVDHEFTKPTSESAFEDMCARVYGVVFGDDLPKKNGRRGQEQAGVDVFVRTKAGRVGIQCKRYKDGALKLADVQKELARADKAGVLIFRLIVATTAASDSKLIRQVHELSDAREDEGKFPVEVEFWDEICGHIRKHAHLQRDYAPNAPGGAFDQLREGTEKAVAGIERVEAKLESVLDQAVPAARPESLNRIVSSQLDHITSLIRAVRYEDARKEIGRVGADLQAFDQHQKARWYLQRGLCTWHLGSGEAAASDFFKAFELFPDDDKVAAAQIRGLLLTGRPAEAVSQGAQLWERFPQSVHIWLAYANAQVATDEAVTEADVPAALKEDPDVLQMLSIANLAAGNLAQALETSQRALQLHGAGFYVRLAALAIALQAAMSDPAKAMNRLLDQKVLEALARCVAAFEPWGEKLLDLQAGPSLEEGVCNLTYALLLTDAKRKAHELISRVKGRGLSSQRLVRVEMDVLRDLGDKDALLSLAEGPSELLADESLLLASEVGANLGLKDLVARLKGVYDERHPQGDARSDTMVALDWVARWKAGDRADVLQAIEAAHLHTQGSFELIQAAARIFKEAGEDAQATSLAERALGLLDEQSHRLDRLAVADLLFELRQFGKAAKLYEDFVVPGRLSTVHTRLLEAYLLGGQARKARQFLQSLPSDWIDDDLARSLAIRVGQAAGDWEFVEPLARVQLKRFPERASSWSFALAVALRSGKMHEFHELLKEVPQELKGTQDQVAQIANTEIRYGQVAAGQNRLYRLYRENLDDAEAAAKYMVGLVAAVVPLPNLEDALEAVAPGSSVTLEDEFGERHVYTLDPDFGVKLPPTEEFFPPDSPDVQRLLGKSAGDQLELPAGMGQSRRFKVHSVSSAYKRLALLARRCIARSLKPAKYVVQVAVPTTGNGADFSQVQAMMQQRTQHAKLAFEGYTSSPITLSILANLLGVNPMDLVVGWPLKDAPPLATCKGTSDELERANQLLSRSEAKYVIDAITLAELVNLDCEEALGCLPKLYASTETLNVIRSRLDEAFNDRSAGRAIDNDGKLGYVEDTAQAKARRVGFFQRMLSALERYCEVAPAYGPESVPEEFGKFKDVLESDEYSVLALAAELGATLVTLDERLANLGAASLGLCRIWPHPLVMAAATAGKLTDVRAGDAAVKMFVWNRSFTPLRAIDLVDLCHYGGTFTQFGLQRLKSTLSSPLTNHEAVVQVTLDFIAMMPAGAISLAAYGELVEHMCEAALRHPESDHQVVVNAFVDVLGQVVSESEPGLSQIQILKDAADARLRVKGELLTNALRRAVGYASQPESERRVRLKVLKCTRRPLIAFDESEEGAPPEASQPIERQEGQVPTTASTGEPVVLASNPTNVDPEIGSEVDAQSD